MESRRGFRMEAPRGEGLREEERTHHCPPISLRPLQPPGHQTKVPRKGSIQALPRAQGQGAMLLPRK